jgi:putative chitinase
VAQLKVREFLSISSRTTSASSSGGYAAGFSATIKSINRIGHVVTSVGRNLQNVNNALDAKNYFSDLFYRETINAQTKTRKEDKKLDATREAKRRRDRRRELDKQGEGEVESSKEVAKETQKQSKKNKLLGPFEKFLQGISNLFSSFIKLAVIYPMLDWISNPKNGERLQTLISLVVGVVKFVGKLVSFGVGSIMNGISDLFGGIQGLSSGNIFAVFQPLVGVVKLVFGIASIKAAQYLFMPWTLISDVKWVTTLFTDLAKAEAKNSLDAEARRNSYKDSKTGIIYSKEEYEAMKKSAARADQKRAQKAGKGFASNLYQDELGSRMQAQYDPKNKGRLTKVQQRTRILGKKFNRGANKFGAKVGTGLKNFATARPMAAGAGLGVLSGVGRIAGGLVSGEKASTAISAGVGQAVGGIALTALLVPFLGPFAPIVGNLIGGFLGGWIGEKLGPIIDPIFKPLGEWLKMSFEVIGSFVSPLQQTFGETFSAIFDLLSVVWEGMKGGMKIIQDFIAWNWENSLTKKAIDGLVWVWQNKDRIGGGIADAFTFNLFDFDKQNRAIGGPVPQMAAGGQLGGLQQEDPETTSMRRTANALVDTTWITLGRMGIAGQSAQQALSSDYSSLKGVLGPSTIVPISGDGLPTQVQKPQQQRSTIGPSAVTSTDGLDPKVVGDKPVKLLTTQPDKFTPQNDRSTRGLLADIYNGLVTLNFGGGGGAGDGSGADITGQTTELGDLGIGDGQYGEIPLTAAAKKAGIQGKELAAFLAQMSHESGQFQFKDEISGGSSSYGGGKRYKGRGYIQLTHDYNYKIYGQKLGIDLLNKPELARDGEIAAKIAILYWMENVRPTVGNDWDNVFLHSKAINYPAATRPSQVNGYADRVKKYDQYKKKLQLAAAGGKIAVDKSKFGLVPVRHLYEPKDVENYQIPVGTEGSFRRFAAGGIYVFSTAVAGPPRMMGNGKGFANTYGHHQGSADGNSNGNPNGPRPGGIPRDYLLSLKSSPTTPDAKGDRHPIRAGVSGIVDSVGEGWGAVRIKDNSGPIFRAGHMSGIRVAVGDRVQPSTIIGTQDSVGMSNGYVHAHIEAKTSALHNAWIRQNVGAVSTDTGADTGDTSGNMGQSSSGGAGQSLLGGTSSGEPADPFAALEEAFKKLGEAYGVQPSPETTKPSTQTPTPGKPNVVPMTPIKPGAQSSNPPGALAPGQRPDKSLTSEQFKVAQAARIEGKANGLTGMALERFVAQSVMNGTVMSTQRANQLNMSSEQEVNRQHQSSTTFVPAITTIAQPVVLNRGGAAAVVVANPLPNPMIR